MRPYFCQELFDIGDNPYVPELVGPDDMPKWRDITIPGHWFVYLIYSDRLRKPIYVGYTNNIHRRLIQHRSKTWWPLVDSITVGLSESKEEAIETENAYISNLGPLFNVAGNRRSWEGRCPTSV